jgi:hypothetical protein
MGGSKQKYVDPAKYSTPLTRDAKAKLTPEERAARKAAGKLGERITKAKVAHADIANTLSLKGVKVRSEVAMLTVEELGQLKIDHDYQRPEDARLVNSILAALESGSPSPSPIHVAIRPNGDRYVVDGQQRWAAHFLAERPCPAILYEVPTIDLERKMFTVLNTVHRVGASYRIRAWPGPAGKLIRWINEYPNSPLVGQVSFSPNSTFASTTILRGLLSLFGGTSSSNATEEMLRALDRLVTAMPRPDLETRTMQYLRLAKEVFQQRRWRPGALAALALVARERWAHRISCPIPNGRSMRNLQVLNWEQLLPTGGMQWVRGAALEVGRRWKEEVRK